MMNYFVSHFSPLLLAQATNTPPSGAAPASPSAGTFVGTVWDMVLKGGWMMIPLAICSLAALAIVLDRWIVTRRARVAPRALSDELASLRESPDRALARAQSSDTPLGRVVAATIRWQRRTRDERARDAGEAGQREVLVLRQRMRLLSAMPQVATMLGLLGTVVGMIRTFTTVAASADALGKTERLAQGIYEAWTATAAGLVIAIPVIIAYQLLMARIDRAAALLDEAVQPWIDAESPRPSAAMRPESGPTSETNGRLVGDAVARPGVSA